MFACVIMLRDFLEAPNDLKFQNPRPSSNASRDSAARQRWTSRARRLNFIATIEHSSTPRHQSTLWVPNAVQSRTMVPDCSENRAISCRGAVRWAQSYSRYRRYQRLSRVDDQQPRPSLWGILAIALSENVPTCEVSSRSGRRFRRHCRSAFPEQRRSFNSKRQSRKLPETDPGRNTASTSQMRARARERVSVVLRGMPIAGVMDLEKSASAAA